MIELRLLGVTELTRDGVTVQSVLAQPKRLALLAYLALAHEGDLTRREQVLAMFWPERREARARNALRQALHFLRRTLGPGIIVKRGDAEVGLDPDLLWVDVHHLRTSAASGHGEAVVDAYRGPLLEGFHVNAPQAFEEWLHGERRRIETVAWRAALDAASRQEETGHHRQALPFARFAADLRPLNEESARLLMCLMHRTGDRTGALRHYEWLEERLDYEFGVAPESVTSDLLSTLCGETPTAGPGTESNGPGESPDDSPDDPPDDPTVHGEPTSEDTEPASEEDPGPSGAAGLRVRRPSIFMGLILGGALLIPAAIPDETGPQDVRIAVMPFENLVPGDSTYFARGVTEDLIAQLSSVPGLVVIDGDGGSAPGLSDPVKAGRELGVPYLLTGSIRFERPAGEPERVRVVPRLVRTRDGAQEWGDVYDAELGSIFDLQARIARRVATALGARLSDDGPRATVPSPDMQAYTFYLRGKEFMAEEWVGPPLRMAATMFREAVAADPRFAAGWAGLSLALSELHHGRWDRTVATRDEAVEAARRALELDSAGFEPRLAGAMVEYRLRGRLPAATEILDALEARWPDDPDLLTVRGYVERAQHDWERALDYQRRALALRPRAARGRGGLAWSLLRLHRYAEADNLMRETLRLFPDMPGFYGTAAMVRMVGWGDTAGARQLLRASGVPDEDERFRSVWYLLHLLERDAEAGLRAAHGSDGEALLSRAMAHRLMGRDDRRDAALDSARVELAGRLSADPEDSHARSLLALAHASLGETADAKEAMGRARAAAPWDPDVHEREAHLHIRLGEHSEAIRVLAELLEGPSYLSPSLLRLDPRFDPLRDDPDFQALLN